MSIIVDLLCGLGGGSIVSIGLYAKNKFSKTSSDELGALPWLWQRNEYGILCVKCGNIDKNRNQPPICHCMDYPKLHFHFKCGDCKFESLMRTADDK